MRLLIVIKRAPSRCVPVLTGFLVGSSTALGCLYFRQTYSSANWNAIILSLSNQPISRCLPRSYSQERLHEQGRLEPLAEPEEYPDDICDDQDAADVHAEACRVLPPEYRHVLIEVDKGRANGWSGAMVSE